MQGSSEATVQKKQERLKTKPASPGEPMAVQESERTISINLVSKEEVEACSFWIGLFRHGDLSPREINSIQSTGIILNRVIDDGVNETSSIMLADASLDPPRYIYLIPKDVNTTLLPKELAPALIPSIKAWNTDKIGIYLAPEVIHAEHKDLCLVELITECIESNLMVDYYLYTGNLGLNVLLNQALTLKKHLGKKKIKVCVFH